MPNPLDAHDAQSNKQAAKLANNLLTKHVMPGTFRSSQVRLLSQIRGLRTHSDVLDEELFGSRGWTRTNDPLINSQLLYRLSYSGPACLTRGDRRLFHVEGLRPGTCEAFPCEFRIIGSLSARRSDSQGASCEKLIGAALYASPRSAVLSRALGGGDTRRGRSVHRFTFGDSRRSSD
jgi:hypothetical protein